MTSDQAVQISAALAQTLGLELTTTIVFSYPSTESLTEVCLSTKHVAVLTLGRPPSRPFLPFAAVMPLGLVWWGGHMMVDGRSFCVRY